MIASTPVIFAALTWAPSGERIPFQSLMRFFGIPVVLIELLVVLRSMATGFQPLMSLKQLPAWARVALVILIAVAFGTAVFVAPDMVTALLRSTMWLAHLVFGLAVAHLAGRSSANANELIWPAITAGLLAYVSITIAFVLSVAEPSRFDWKYFGLAVINVRQVGFYAAVGAASSVGLAVTRTERRWRLLFGVCAFLLFGLSFWSGTRGSVLAVWGACALGIVWFRQLRSLRAWVTLFGCTLGGFLLSLLHSVPNKHYGFARLLASAHESTAEGITSGRISIWLSTWHTFLRRPLFGYGEGQFHGVVMNAGEFNHPHNALLQLLLQWGAIGTFCFAALAYLVLRYCYVVVSHGRTQDLCAFLVAVSLLAMSLYEGTLFHPYPIMMIAVALGVIGSSHDKLANWDGASRDV